jgi:hypothetical protein
MPPAFRAADEFGRWCSKRKKPVGREAHRLSVGALAYSTVTVGCALERTRTFAHRKLKVRAE